MRDSFFGRPGFSRIVATARGGRFAWACCGRVPFETGVTTGALVNFALLVLCVCFRISGAGNPVETFWVNSSRTCSRRCCSPALLLGAGLFHHVVAAEATALRQAERERFIEQSLSDDAAYAALQAETRNWRLRSGDGQERAPGWTSVSIQLAHHGQPEDLVAHRIVDGIVRDLLHRLLRS